MLSKRLAPPCVITGVRSMVYELASLYRLQVKDVYRVPAISVGDPGLFEHDEIGAANPAPGNISPASMTARMRNFIVLSPQKENEPVSRALSPLAPHPCGKEFVANK